MRSSSGVRRALFVGGFSVGKDGTEGGQVYACRSLVASPLSDLVEWKIVDSTQRSLPPPPLPVRIFDAAWRLLQCVWHLLFSRVQTVLVFTNFSWLSILEKGLVLAAASGLRKHTVVSFRSFPLLPGRAVGPYVRFVRSVCRRCDRIICQSQRAADEIVRLFDVDRRRIVVIPNWIDTSRYDAVCGRRSEADGRQDGDPVRILYVGWMRDIKGVQFLIPAVARLLRTHPDVRLTLCGGGGLLEELKQRARELNISHCVDFRGWVENDAVRSLMAESDLLVLPSLAEGMPNAIIQAMACGLPVVSTRVTSIPEIVKHGENGILVEPASVESLCEGLKTLVESPERRRQMAENNRVRARRRHDISSAWRRVANALNLEVGSAGTDSPHSGDAVAAPLSGAERSSETTAPKETADTDT